MSEIQLHIITPLGEVLDIKASSVSIPTISGVITILKGHMPLISVLKAGELVFDVDKTKSAFTVWNGIAEVKEVGGLTTVYVLTHRSEASQDIDSQQAEAAYQRAKELRDGLHQTDVEFARFESLMEKELNRVRVAKKYH